MVRPQQSPNVVKVRVAPVRRCNNASKLLEYLLHLPYPVLYEGTSYFIHLKENKKYIYSSIKLGKMSSNRNVNIFTCDTKITKLFFDRVLILDRLLKYLNTCITISDVLYF